MIHRSNGHGNDTGRPVAAGTEASRGNDITDDDAATDELVRLAAQQIDDDTASALAFDERRLQWQGEEERRRIEEGDLNGAHRRAVMQLARRIQAAALSARLPMRRRDGRPSIRVGNGRSLIIDAIDRAGLEEVLTEDRLAPRIDLGVAAGVGRDLWDEPCASWIELPVDIPAGRYIGLGVNGDSMEPLMHTGDTILVRVGTDVQPNTVIVARHPDDGYVVKRVDRLTPTTIQLASLNAGYPVLAIPRDPSLIVGTVVLRWCAHEGQSA